MACRCSGKTTIATTENGCAALTLLITSRRSAMCRTRVSPFYSAKSAAKRYVPPQYRTADSARVCCAGLR